MTPTEVEDRFEEAARTLRRLPDARPRGYGSFWPPVVRNANEAYGWTAARSPRIVPSPDAITRMDEALGWLAWLEPDDARIVWLRAEGERWKPICRRVGISRATAWRRWAAALITVSNRTKTAARVRARKSARKSDASSGGIRRANSRETVAKPDEIVARKCETFSRFSHMLPATLGRACSRPAPSGGHRGRR